MPRGITPVVLDDEITKATQRDTARNESMASALRTEIIELKQQIDQLNQAATDGEPVEQRTVSDLAARTVRKQVVLEAITTVLARGGQSAA